MRRHLLAGAGLAVLAMAAGGVHDRAAAQAPPPAAPAPGIVETPPPAPPPRAEVAPPQPGPTHVWVAGHWAWRRHEYVWVGGHWAIPRHPGWVWVPGHWAARRHGYVWVEGHWRPR